MFNPQYRRKCRNLNQRHKAEVEAFRKEYPVETTTLFAAGLALVLSTAAVQFSIARRGLKN